MNPIDLARAEEDIKSRLSKSEHALADGILCAINATTEIRSAVLSIQKVIAGDAEYETPGIIQNQKKNQEDALQRHKEVLEKFHDLEKKTIKDLQTQVDALKIWQAKVTTYGSIIMIAYPIVIQILMFYISK